MNDNFITIQFPPNKTRAISASAWQYDYGQIAVFEGIDLDQNFEVHLANVRDKGSASVHLGQNRYCEIPSAYFASGLPIYGWIYVHPTSRSGETEYSFVIPVKTRPAPDPQEPTPEEQDLIERVLYALNHDRLQAEAYAVGTRDGEPVTEDDETYHNNSKYYAENTAAVILDLVRSIQFHINEEEGTLEVTMP